MMSQAKWLVCIIRVVVLLLVMGPVLSSRAQEPEPGAEGPGAQLSPGEASPANAESRIELRSDSGEPTGAHQIVFAPDGRKLALRDGEQRIHVCENPSGRELFVVAGHESAVTAIAFSPDGRYLVTAASGVSDPVRAWDVATGQEHCRWNHSALAVRFVGPRQFITIGAVDVHRCDIGMDSGSEALISQIPNHTNPLAISHAGTHVLLSQPSPAASQHYSVLLFELREQKSVELAALPFAPQRAVFAPSDELIAVCGNRSPEIAVYALDRPSTYHLLVGHAQTVYSLAFSPDGRHLASGGFDGKCKIWETLTWRTVATLQTHRGTVNAISVSSDGQWLATGSAGIDDRSACVWSLVKLLFGETTVQDATSDPLEQPFWEALGSEDAELAYRAMSHALRDPQGTAYLSRKLEPLMARVSKDQVLAWIALLDDDRFAVREEAFVNLMRYRAGYTDLLLDAERLARSLEARIRLRQLLTEGLSETVMPESDWRRMNRVVYMLELLDTDAARALLQSLADHHPDGRVARVARMALERSRAEEPEIH